MAARVDGAAPGGPSDATPGERLADHPPHPRPQVILALRVEGLQVDRVADASSTSTPCRASWAVQRGHDAGCRGGGPPSRP